MLVDFRIAIFKSIMQKEDAVAAMQTLGASIEPISFKFIQLLM
jgi:hypothetical protein